MVCHQPRGPGQATVGIGAASALLALVALGCLYLGCEPEGEPATGPMVGKPAPEVADEVEQWVNGHEVDLADLKGKLVLLCFWHPRDGKSPAALGRVQGFAAQHGGQGLVTIGLCVCDEPAEVEPLIEEHKLTFRVGLDCDADVHLRKYRIGDTGSSLSQCSP